jgi:PAS domain S-box-containing protein
MIRCFPAKLLCEFLALAAFWVGSATAAEAKRVLMVHSFMNVAPPFTKHSQAFQAELIARMGEPVDLDEISLNVARYASLDMEEALVEFMRKREGKWQPDLVVPIGSPAARFIAQYRDRLFPKTTPVIYTGLDKRRLSADELANNAAFVGSSYDLPGLVEDILQIAPDTKHIAILIGASQLEKYWKETIQQEYAQFTNRVNFTYFDDLSFAQMLARAKTMPPQSFLLLVLLMRDASGVTHDADEALQKLHAVANAPINGIFEDQLGLGIVGGRLYRGELEGIESARVAVRVLHGEPAKNFPPKVVGPRGPTYDWRELQRWKIKKERLPAGSKVLFREPSLWQKHKGRIVAIFAVFIAQAVLIFALLLNLVRRKRLQVELHQTQESATLAGDAAHLGMLVWETSHSEMWTTDKWKEIHGYEAKEQVTFQNFLSRVHAQDRKVLERSINDAVKRKGSFLVQHRVILPNGHVRWISKNGRVEPVGSNGSARVLGIAIDITEQVLAETANRELSGRLIGAQEEERKRIARDLHDDVNQRLAMLSMETDQLGRMGMAPDAQPLIEEIATQVKDLATEIHNLSYQLHPAKLEHLGLVAATRSLCNQQSRVWALPVDFIQAGIPRELKQPTALTLYRIVQESLQNIGKHSQATQARVELTRENDAVRLLITDNGRGFDMELVKQHAGLGLLGMRERVHSVHGHLLIQSSPGKGTSIEVRVPISEEPRSLTRLKAGCSQSKKE